MSNSTATPASPFTFRASRIADRPVVFVTSGRNIYSVVTGRHHKVCNCPHYQHRLSGTLGKCKHIVSAEEWERAQDMAARLLIDGPADYAAPFAHEPRATGSAPVQPAWQAPSDARVEEAYGERMAAARRDRDALWP